MPARPVVRPSSHKVSIKLASAAHSDMDLAATHIILTVGMRRYLASAYDVRYVYGVDLHAKGEEIVMLAFHSDNTETESLRSTLHNKSLTTVEVFANGRRFSHRCFGRSTVVSVSGNTAIKAHVNGFFAHDFDADISEFTEGAIRLTKPRKLCAHSTKPVKKYSLKDLQALPAVSKPFTPVPPAAVGLRKIGSRKPTVIRLRG